MVIDEYCVPKWHRNETVVVVLKNRYVAVDTEPLWESVKFSGQSETRHFHVTNDIIYNIKNNQGVYSSLRQMTLNTISTIITIQYNDAILTK